MPPKVVKPAGDSKKSSSGRYGGKLSPKSAALKAQEVEVSAGPRFPASPWELLPSVWGRADVSLQRAHFGSLFGIPDGPPCSLEAIYLDSVFQDLLFARRSGFSLNQTQMFSTDIMAPLYQSLQAYPLLTAEYCFKQCKARLLELTRGMSQLASSGSERKLDMLSVARTRVASLEEKRESPREEFTVEQAQLITNHVSQNIFANFRLYQSVFGSAAVPAPGNHSQSVSYYEVRVDVCAAEKGAVAVGMTASSSVDETATSAAPGTLAASFALRSDGTLFLGSSGVKATRWTAPFAANDVIGAGLDWSTGGIFFTKNGALLGTVAAPPTSSSPSASDAGSVAETASSTAVLPPLSTPAAPPTITVSLDLTADYCAAVGLAGAGTHVTANFGQRAFLYKGLPTHNALGAAMGPRFSKSCARIRIESRRSLQETAALDVRADDDSNYHSDSASRGEASPMAQAARKKGDSDSPFDFGTLAGSGTGSALLSVHEWDAFLAACVPDDDDESAPYTASGAAPTSTALGSRKGDKAGTAAPVQAVADQDSVVMAGTVFTGDALPRLKTRQTPHSWFKLQYTSVHEQVQIETVVVDDATLLSHALPADDVDDSSSLEAGDDNDLSFGKSMPPSLQATSTTLPPVLHSTPSLASVSASAAVAAAASTAPSFTPAVSSHSSASVLRPPVLGPALAGLSDKAQALVRAAVEKAQRDAEAVVDASQQQLMEMRLNKGPALAATRS